jgi:hypothetical protein
MLSKWYLDCVSDDGDVFIGYAASLRWGKIAISYSSTLQSAFGKPPESNTTLRKSATPRLAGSCINWSSPQLDFSGTWSALAQPIGRVLLESDTGNIEWNCLQPRARAEIFIRGKKRLAGFGYVEPPTIGICYTHPRSRVSRLTALAGIPLHPTPLYSILGNLIGGIIMARLWSVHADFSLIVGLFLVLNGLARFVEESYRGEPQTPIKAGLRTYQWLAIGSVMAGVFATMVSATGQPPEPSLNWQSLIAAAGFSWFAWFALGVDFPTSNKRFARLA